MSTEQKLPIIKDGTIKCDTCKGTGKVDPTDSMVERGETKCWDCGGYGYRVVIKRGTAERNLTVSQYNSGNLGSYF